ncbi:leucine-rich repeat-containing protein 15-like isoform X2 [Bradysia coprophila]|nr:leucine-rich repeat-containing protein 15-like isoform X2 [Bradysia coprophila]XP_037038356.1 leucine-rich repeat-containing protein 15-like isoform X2 [Bradysia coprophila]
MFPGKCDLYNENGSIEVYRNVRLMWFDKTPEIDYIPTAIFVKFPRLRHLRLSNGIRTIDKAVFTNATELLTLELPGNKLKVVPEGVFSHATTLRQIHLCSNEIAVIESGAFSQLPNLVMLDLSSNFIETIRDGTFSYITNLEVLDLNNNAISTIEGNAFKMPNLKSLLLSKNKIHILFDEIFTVAPRLSYLELMSTNLHHINNALKNLPELLTLHLSDNDQVQDLHLQDFIQLPQLQGLSLRNTSVKLSDDLTNMTSSSHLLHLDLSHNNITDANIFYKLTAFAELQQVNLEHNAMVQLEGLELIGEHFKSLTEIGVFGSEQLKTRSSIAGQTSFVIDSELASKILVRNWHNTTDEQRFIEYANEVINHGG